MTDKEKLDKLVAEIERRITFFNKQSVRKITTDDNSCALALQGVLCFYDSMQKEPQVKKLAGNQHEDKTCKENGDSLTQESASEDLEKEVYEHLWKGRMGADVSKPIYFSYDELLEVARHFAAWQKQQLMAKAVDATVHSDAGGYPYIPQMELYDYEKDIPFAKEGDKYKVILIKED